MTQPDAQRSEFLQRLGEAQVRLDEGFERLPPSPQPTLGEDAAAILGEAAERMHDNYPYAHPLYAGQMLKPPHPIARAAYTLAMSVNPNNHALDGGRASSAMEIEAVAALAKMFGWPQHLGHLSSSGTFANLEALWVAGQLHREREARARSRPPTRPTTRIPASPACWGLPCVDDPHRQHRPHGPRRPRRRAQDAQDIGTVVATLGTTAVGAVDPLDRILELRQEYSFRIHVDSAYGGYFTLARNLGSETRAAFDAIPHADSLVVDPHKHGLQPYGCGCILFRDPTVGRFYKHDSPYTYFSSKDLHLGEISLECSRAGASAVALWATQRLLPYIPGGEFARGLEAGREAALAHAAKARGRRPICPAHRPAGARYSVLGATWQLHRGDLRPVASHLRRGPAPGPLSGAGHASRPFLSRWQPGLALPPMRTSPACVPS